MIVNRPDWSEGNALAFIITGTGKRVAESFEGEPAAAPLLHVEFGIGEPTNTAPRANAGENQTFSLPQNSCSLAGAVYDDGLPEPATITVSWSVISGPGTVVFANVDSHNQIQ